MSRSKHTSIHEVIKEYLDYMLKKYPHGHFKCGISHLGADIRQASKCYEEASIAFRLAVK